MKKFLCVVMSVVMFALMSSVNAFAIQEDVYKAYANELSWLNKTSSVEEYCVYDMNKDGIKELMVLVKQIMFTDFIVVNTVRLLH